MSRTDYCILQGSSTISPSASPPTGNSTGNTFRPTTRPTPTPTARPSQSPTDTPSSFFDSFRFQAINATIRDIGLPFNFPAYSWLLLDDTWVTPEEAEDPIGLFKERYAIAALYFDSNGTEWPNQGQWLSSELSVCQWLGSGIGCNAQGKVDYLEISDWSRIVGSIPSELKALTMLRHLAFDSHELGGSFPSEIGTLSLLTRLDLRKLLSSACTNRIAWHHAHHHDMNTFKDPSF